MSFVWKRPEGRIIAPEGMMRIIIRVADELGMPDKRGACIIAGMTVRQESDFWRPGNDADPAFKANPDAFPHDSMGNDGKSVGPYQQQTSDPPPAQQWGWGGLYGDPEGTRRRMDPYESTKLFLAALKKLPYRASNAVEANNWAQRVQQSGVPDGYAKHWGAINTLYDAVLASPTPVAPSPVPSPPPPPVFTPVPYGMPNGSNSGGYGNSGVKFPQWIYDLGNAFGVKPSTYPGHQESDRNEGGYAPNPQHLNRGVDWAAPGTPDEVDRMQRFADYCFSIRDQLEQVIWWNPRTNKKIGVGGGKDVTNTPYYDYPGGYDDHRDHVHTRFSHSVPLPGGAAPSAPPAALRPDFVELDYYSNKKVGQGFSVRSRKPINFFIHTEEGNGSAESLAKFCDGSNGVSYHYTVRDGKVCDVVDTDYYSWSVLSANVFSINACFAGSRAGMSRQEWLARERDIEIVAYLAVQDARKYGFPTDVIAPPYHQAAGISDHKYVTKQLGIGNHTDVGDNFPWDVFTRYVNKYANPTNQPAGEDMAQVDQQVFNDLVNKVNLLFNAFIGDQVESLSPMRTPGQGKIGNLVTILRFMDSNIHVPLVKMLAEVGDPDTLTGLNIIINTDLSRYPDRAKDVTLAKNILAAAQRSWMAAKAITASKNTTPAVAAPASAPAAAPAVPAVVDTRELTAAFQEIARLREENGRLQAQVSAAPVAPTTSAALVPAESSPTEPLTSGEIAGAVVDSVTGYNKHLMAMDANDRIGLAASLQALQPPSNEPRQGSRK
jgi:N-acetyl-anhydromuramyl-L-alanine amidase AmpD